MSLLLAAALSFFAPGGVSAQDLSVRIQRGADAPPAVLSWYRDLDAVLDSSDSFFRDLEAGSRRPTVASGKRALEGVRSLAALYSTFSRDASAKSGLGEAALALESLWKGLGEGAPLPEKVLPLVYSLEKGSLHHRALSMRQAALEASGPPEPVTPNALLTFTRGHGDAELEALDLGALPAAPAADAPLTPTLRALLLAFCSGPAPSGTAVLGRNRLWLREGPARIYACPRSAQAGGEIRVVYEGGASSGEQASFYVLAKTLVEGGFAVSVEDGVLRAFLDASRSRMDAAAMAERFALAARAAAATKPLAEYMAEYLADTTSEAENASRLDALARLRIAEGDLAFLPRDPKLFAKAAAEHISREGERESLRLGMNKALSALRLGEFPPVPVGRRTIGLFYNAPIEAGLARGEFRLSGGSVALDPSYSPLPASFQRLAADDEERLSPLLDGLGAVLREGRGTIEAGQWALDADRWLSIRLLRNEGRYEQGSARLLSRRGAKERVDMKAAFALLEEAGLIGPKARPASFVPLPAVRPQGSAAAVFGRTLHFGPPVSARVTYDKAKALLGDRIFVTPYVSAADAKALSRAKGLITTLGGAQSAALAAAAGVPAVDLPQAQWTQTSGIVIRLPVFSAARGGTLQEPASWKRMPIREGTAIRMDPASGAVELPDPGRQAFLLRLEEAMNAYDRGSGAEPLARWVEAQLKGNAPAQQRRELVSALRLEISRRKSAGTLPDTDEALLMSAIAQ